MCHMVPVYLPGQGGFDKKKIGWVREFTHPLYPPMPTLSMYMESIFSHHLLAQLHGGLGEQPARRDTGQGRQAQIWARVTAGET